MQDDITDGVEWLVENNYADSDRVAIVGGYSTRYIGDLWKDRKMLAGNSPARRADEITVPVLLMHGTDDTVVDISQSRGMARQLKKHGKDHQYVVFEEGDHHLSLYRNRLRYLTEMEGFLDICLNKDR